MAIWLFSSLLSRAFDDWLIPLIGFFVLPWATLAYAGMWDRGPGGEVTGFEWFIVGFAFLADLSSYAGSRYRRAEPV